MGWFDVGWGEGRRECPGRHDMLWGNRVRLGVEIDEIAASHIDGADTQTDCTRIETIEVDKLFECVPQLAGVIKASGIRGSVRIQPCARVSPCEESGHGGHYLQARTQLVTP